MAALPLTALGLVATGALVALGDQIMRNVLQDRRSAGSEAAPDQVGGEMGDTTYMSRNGSYELVGRGSDVMGAIGASDLLLGGVLDDDEEDALLSGLEDIIGAGDDDALLEALAVSGLGNSEIVGTAAHHKAKAASKKAKVRSALRQVALRNAGAVVNRGLDRRRRYPLGFVPTTVAAATSASIPSAPQNLFRPERLVIPSDIAFDTGVRDIKVGNQSQLVQSVEVPAALFSEVAINTGVTFDTAEVGNQVSVDVRNKSGTGFEFSAGLVGTIAK